MAILQDSINKAYGSAFGKIGKGIDAVGGFLGNPGKERNISEKLQLAGSMLNPVKQAYAAPSPSSTPIDWNQYQPANYSPNNASYSPQQTTRINKNTGSGGGGGNQGYQDPFANLKIQSPNEPFGGGPSQTDVINQEFEGFNNLLNEQESLSRSRFDEAKGLYDTQKANQEEIYNKEKQTQTEGIKKTENLNLAKVRQLLGELSQRDAARTAITGGGSVSEALGERFGREAQSRLGNVMDQTQQAIERVNTFYDNAITKLSESYQANITLAKAVLDDNLMNISVARQQSAATKQRNTMEAWKEYYDRVNTAKLEAANYKANYDMWKSQQDQAFAATQNFAPENANTYNTGLTPSYSQLPQAGMAQGQEQTLNPFYQTKKRPGEEEEENNPIYPYGANFAQNMGFTR